MKRPAPEASPTCPACGAGVEEGAVICGACDHILDSSFLDEAEAADLDDEGTDPRGDVPPDLEDEGTDPGAAPPAPLADEGTDPGGAAPAELADEGTDPGAEMPTMVGFEDEGAGPSEATVVGPAPGPPGDDDEGAMRPTPAGGLDALESGPVSVPELDGGPAPRSASSPQPPPADADPPPAARPTPPPPSTPAAPAASRPVPPPPPSRPGASTPGPPRSRSSPGTGSSPGLLSSSGSASGETKRPSLRERLDFDTSSELMDDYDKFFQDAWRRFVAAPVAEKIVASGAVLALLTVLMPWRIAIDEAGIPVERIGLSVGGWLVLLLGVGALAVGWIRLTRPKMNQLHLLLGQIGVAALGLLWSGVGFLAGLLAAASAPDHLPVQPGPAYGVFLCGLAWTIALVGGILGFKDVTGGRPKPKA